MPRVLFVTMMLALMFVTVSAGAETFDIGERGAQIDLNGRWKRKTYIQGLGDDQFLGPKAVRVIVVEFPTPFDHLDGVAAMYKETASNIASLATIKVKKRSRMKLFERNNIAHASGYLLVKENGIKVTYGLSILGKDGLAYLCQVIAVGGGKETEIRKVITDVSSDFAFPKSDSKWVNSLQPRPRNIKFDWGELRVSYRQPLWEDDDSSEDALLSLESVNDLTSFYVFEYTDDTASELIDSLRSFFEETYPGLEFLDTRI